MCDSSFIVNEIIYICSVTFFLAVTVLSMFYHQQGCTLENIKHYIYIKKKNKTTFYTAKTHKFNSAVIWTCDVIT